jgi:hypothetical protein
MKIKKFNSFIKESDEQEGDPLSPEGSRLRELGLAPNLEWDERYDLMINEWNEDPEVNKAYVFLRKRVEELVKKYVTDEDREDESSDFLQWIQYALDSPVSDTGMLEYLIIGETT